MGNRRRTLTQAQKDRALMDLKRLTEERDEPDAPESEAGDSCEECAAPPSARMYTDAQLAELLAMYGYDVRACAYNVLLRKAEHSGVRLPGGLELPDQSAYWLRLAASVRPNGSRPLARADGT